MATSGFQASLRWRSSHNVHIKRLNTALNLSSFPLIGECPWPWLEGHEGKHMTDSEVLSLTERCEKGTSWITKLDTCLTSMPEQPELQIDYKLNVNSFSLTESIHQLKSKINSVTE